MFVRVVALLLAVTVLAPVPSAVARADYDRPIRLQHTNRLFSPNGDGRHDRLVVRFVLPEKAHVSVQVRVSGGTRRVQDVDLGNLAAGVHSWHWRGRDDAGRPVPRGDYRVTLTAANRSRTGSIWVTAGVDRGELVGDARAWLSRRTIYPDTVGVSDRIELLADMAFSHFPRGTVSGDLQIRGPGGAVVRKQMQLRPGATWAARDDSGARVPPGEYDVAITFRDSYGNRRTTHRAITVSDQQMVPATWSTTVRAADAEQIPIEDYCPPTPSERFEGGLTIAATGGCDRAAFRPRVHVPFRIDPTSSWRVSVTGGPTTPGGPDSAEIYLSFWTYQIPTAPGDATTTTDLIGVPRYEWHEPSDQAFWVVVDDPGASYDVAEYTVELHYYVPPPG